MRRAMVGLLIAAAEGCGGEAGEQSVPSAASAAAEQEATMGHLEHYAFDTTRVLDFTVFAAIAKRGLAPVLANPANDQLMLTDSRVRAMLARLSARLEQDGFPVNGVSFKMATNGNTGVPTSPVDGDHQALLERGPTGPTYGPEVSVAPSLTGVRRIEREFVPKLETLFWLATLTNTGAKDLGSFNLKATKTGCLYTGVDAAGKWKAFLVAAPPDTTCAESISLAWAQDATNHLTVLYPQRVDPVSVDNSLTGDDLPLAARWEDGGAEPQVGVKCGRHWCILSTAEGAERERQERTGRTVSQKRRQELHGYVDYQVLAEPDIGGSTLVPSPMSGRITPEEPDSLMAPGLSNQNKSFKVADVELTGSFTGAPATYDKLGMVKPGKYVLRMCYGKQKDCFPSGSYSAPKKSCLSNLYGFIHAADNATTGKVFEMCHQTKETPGEFTARWQWVRTDETWWIRCPWGCCSPNL